MMLNLIFEVKQLGNIITEYELILQQNGNFSTTPSNTEEAFKLNWHDGKCCKNHSSSIMELIWSKLEGKELN